MTEIKVNLKDGKYTGKILLFDLGGSPSFPSYASGTSRSQARPPASPTLRGHKIAAGTRPDPSTTYKSHSVLPIHGLALLQRLPPDPQSPSCRNTERSHHIVQGAVSVLILLNVVGLQTAETDTSAPYLDVNTVPDDIGWF